MSHSPIFIYSSSHLHWGFFLLPLVLASFLLFFLLPEDLGSLFLVISLWFFVGGWLVNREKKSLSFTITPFHIQYHRNHAGWCLRWADIHSIDIPCLSIEGFQQPLPWLGLKLKDYDSFLSSISYRLGAQMMREQQGLIYLAYRQNKDTQEKALDDILFNDTPFETASGKTYTGLLAMMAHRMKFLHQNFGYDLMIGEEYFSEPKEDVVGQFRQLLTKYRST